MLRRRLLPLFAQNAPQDLARAVARHGSDEDELGRHLVPSKPFAQPGAQLLAVHKALFMGGFANDDVGTDELIDTVGGFGADDGGIDQGWVLQQLALDLRWGDLPAADFDEVFGAVDDVEGGDARRGVRYAVTDVTGAEPVRPGLAGREGGGGGGGVGDVREEGVRCVD